MLLVNASILWRWGDINSRCTSNWFIRLKLGLSISTSIHCWFLAVWNHWSGLWLICLSFILILLVLTLLIRCTRHRSLIACLISFYNSKLVSIHLLRSFLINSCCHSSWNSCWTYGSFSFLVWSRLYLSWSSFAWILLRLLLLLLRNCCCSILIQFFILLVSSWWKLDFITKLFFWTLQTILLRKYCQFSIIF